MRWRAARRRRVEHPELHDVYQDLHAVEEGTATDEQAERALKEAQAATVELSHELLINELALETSAGRSWPSGAEMLRARVVALTQDLRRLRRLTEAARRRSSRT